MASKFVIPEDELNELQSVFFKADEDGNGFLEMKELRAALKLVGFDLPGYEVRMLEEDFKKSDLNKDGHLSMTEFQNLYVDLKTQKETRSSFKNAVKPMNTDVKIVNKSENQSVHFVKDSEKEAFCRWINQNLEDDTDLDLISRPLNSEGHDLFQRCTDGILLCKLINFCVPDTIDERSLNKGKKISIYQQLENLELALRSAESIGCHIVNVRPKDIREGKEHLILGLLWQTIQIGLFSEINLVSHPGLMRLLSDDETQDDLLKLTKEEILLKWVNYQLADSNYVGENIRNFSEDVKDSVVYVHLLNKIAPKDNEEELTFDPLIEKDLLKRAEKTLCEAEKINARDFVNANEIVAGHQKLNMAFVANLFNKHPALDNADEDDVLIIEETREEKTFRNWMNSLGVKPKVNYLYSDIQSCLVIFQLYDIIKPSTVDWNRVVQNFSPKKQKFEKLDNCNYAIEIGKKNMNFKLVGIQGSNLLDGHKNFTLALIWQLMKAYVMSLLEKLADQGGPIGDEEIIQWANEKLRSGAKDVSFQNFQDPSLSDSRIICDLIDAIRPGSIKYENLQSGGDTDSRMANARYAVSIARKIGARVFALPEDIVEVKSKMVMTIFAVLMILDYQLNK